MRACDEMVQLLGRDVALRLSPVFGVDLGWPERGHPAVYQDAHVLARRSLQQPMAQPGAGLCYRQGRHGLNLAEARGDVKSQPAR